MGSVCNLRPTVSEHRVSGFKGLQPKNPKPRNTINTMPPCSANHKILKGPGFCINLARTTSYDDFSPPPPPPKTLFHS